METTLRTANAEGRSSPGDGAGDAVAPTVGGGGSGRTHILAQRRREMDLEGRCADRPRQVDGERAQRLCDCAAKWPDRGTLRCGPVGPYYPGKRRVGEFGFGIVYYCDDEEQTWLESNNVIFVPLDGGRGGMYMWDEWSVVELAGGWGWAGPL